VCEREKEREREREREKEIELSPIKQEREMKKLIAYASHHQSHCAEALA